MKTRKLRNRLFAFMAFMVIFAMPGYALTDPDVPRAPRAVKALLLLDDLYGASVNIEDNQNNILENLESYGWEVSLACCSKEVNPAPWASKQGCEVLTPDLLTYRLDNALEWDVIIIAPGESHRDLMDCPFVMSVLAQARENNIPIAAWCQGVRVLAEADVIDGVEISGYAGYEDEYLAAGADFIGASVPPVVDQYIITCGNETAYRKEMCELIRSTVEKAAFLRESRARKAEKLEFKLCPNPISSSSEIAFCLEEEAIVHIAVFDQQGHMVMDVVKQPFQQGKNSVTFNPSSLPTGIYYVYLFSDGRMGMQKCMII